MLSFWLPLETRDVENHLGDEDTVTPSTYSEVFANPTCRGKRIGLAIEGEHMPVATYPLDGFRSISSFLKIHVEIDRFPSWIILRRSIYAHGT